jgi:hypothetical protein
MPFPPIRFLPLLLLQNDDAAATARTEPQEKLDPSRDASASR